MKVREKLGRGSYILRCCLYVAARLMGVQREKLGWRFDGAIMAGWVYLLGMPLGAIIMGPAFSILLWSVIVVIITALVNADDAFYYALWLKENNVDGEEPEGIQIHAT